MQVEVKYKTIDGPEDLEENLKHIEFLNAFFPVPFTSSYIAGFVTNNPSSLVLIFANGVPICMFVLALYKRSAEIHGVFRPDLDQIVYNPGKLKQSLFSDVFSYVFEDEKKKVLIMKSDPSNKGVRGLRIIWGMEKLMNLDKGRCVLKLTRDKYFEMKQQKGL